MKITTRYDKGEILKVRLRDTNQFYNFVAGSWVGTETGDCSVVLSEYADSSTLSSLYSEVIVVPAGVYNIEIINTSNEVVASAEKEIYGIQRGVPLANFTFSMVSSSDGRTPLLGVTITAERKLDAGAFAVCSNAVTEVGGGVYTLNLSATDMDGELITLRFTHSSAVTKVLTIKTSQ